MFNRGLPMPEEIHKIIYHNNEPIVEADLFFNPKLCVFIDGPDHDKEHIKQNDETKRRKLKMLNFKYVVIHHSKINEGINNLITELDINREDFKTTECEGHIFVDNDNLSIENQIYSSLKRLL